MSSSTIALALETTLDITAARRLYDYAALDDEGVTSAIEHAYMQRFGRIDWPANLCRLTRVVMVVTRGDDLTIVDTHACDPEAKTLERLFADWPRGPGDVVSWSGRECALISVRAFMNDIALPAGLREASSIALAGRLDPSGIGTPRPGHDSEAEWSGLVDGNMSAEPADASTTEKNSADARVAARTRATAINRYRLWLRWQHVHGWITDADRNSGDAALRAAATPA